MFMKPRAVQIREKVMIPLVRVHQWMDTNLKIRGCLSIWNGRQQHNIKLKPTNAHTVVLGSNLNQKSIVNKVLQYEVTESLGKEVAEGGSAWNLCRRYYTYIHILTQMMEKMMLCCLWILARSRTLATRCVKYSTRFHHACTINGGCSGYTPPFMQGPETNKMYYTQPSCLITAPNTKGDCWP